MQSISHAASSSGTAETSGRIILRCIIFSLFTGLIEGRLPAAAERVPSVTGLI